MTHIEDHQILCDGDGCRESLDGGWANYRGVKNRALENGWKLGWNDYCPNCKGDVNA